MCFNNGRLAKFGKLMSRLRIKQLHLLIESTHSLIPLNKKETNTYNQVIELNASV